MADYDRFNLRFPPQLRERLEAAAKASTRSLHAEILFRLEQSFNTEAAEAALKREEILRLVNEAIDERLERERSIKPVIERYGRA